jgi:TRAF3-interacting protein 1
MGDTTEKTIEILSRIVKKTPLTAKLLSKPPFRYLHDLMTEIMSRTGFAQGLYFDFELDSENIKVTIQKRSFCKGQAS